MKKIYKYIGLVVIMIFSFYYTDKLALMVQDKNPIMKKINEQKKKMDVASVNAIINNEKIIPGKNGLSINNRKSFSLMKSFGAFSYYYLIFEQEKPKLSIENNKDKIIIAGNSSNKQISFILEYDENLISYFESNKIKGDILVNKDNISNINYLEPINNDFINYSETELLLKKNKVNKNICFTNNKENLLLCKNYNKYLVNTDLVLSNDNVYNIKNNIKNGSIILVKNNTSINTLNIVLNQAKFKGLKIVYLSELISEENKD